MPKLVFLLCGVESTGKSTAINNIYNYLANKGYKVKVVTEAGRDVCQESGGVFEMTHLDYERILHLHQTNFLKEYADTKCDIILLDTDSTYTRYYLEKDNKLLEKDLQLCKQLIANSEEIAKANILSNKISDVIYLNSDCPFVQDGTRTYETTRKEDDNTLYNLYKSIYKTIEVVKGKEYDKRTQQIINVIEKRLAQIK